MKKLIPLLLVLAVLALIVAPATAQDATESASGGVVVDSTFGSSLPSNFNPVTSDDGTAWHVISLLLPTLVSANPESQVIEPGAPGGVAEAWDISEDGKTYTIHLRKDFKWSDGTPVTAKDFEAAWKAVASKQTNTAAAFLLDVVDDQVATDDYTLKVTFKAASCEALNNIAAWPIQASRYADGNWAKLNDEDYASPDYPSIGPYEFSSVVPDQTINLKPDPDGQYPDGNVKNAGYQMKLVGDQTIQIQQLLANQLDFVDFVPQDFRADVRAGKDKGAVDTYEYSPGDSWHYISFNLANPANPQPALDENGNPVQQDPNPFFADVRVRQAITMALDIDTMMEKAVAGEASRMNSNYSEGTWPYDPTIPAYAYDPDAAGKLLDEAGWVDDDNNPATPRVANDKAMYAKPGTKFEFTLITNDGNPSKQRIGELFQDYLSKIGVKVDFQTIDFNVLQDRENQQNYDMLIGTWGNTVPFTADQSQFWAAVSDTPGGSNFGSYVNPELNDLMQQALTVPGCDQQARAKIYSQVQQILHRDLPYIWLWTLNGFYAWNAKLQGVSPYPGLPQWNLNEWVKLP